MKLTTHQLKQKEVIEDIARRVACNSLNFTTVSPVEDFDNDPRMCITSVHFPHTHLLDKIQHELIEPLRAVESDYYYYTNSSLHMTVKNVRVINDPPRFDEGDVNKAIKVFGEVIPRHKKYNVYFYRLLLFPNNLALIGTTDEELDRIVLDLDDRMKAGGIADDKIYANSKYFFCNMTLSRFGSTPSAAFREKVSELSETLKFEPYTVDSVSLLSGNAVLRNKKILGVWKLVKSTDL